MAYLSGAQVRRRLVDGAEVGAAADGAGDVQRGDEGGSGRLVSKSAQHLSLYSGNTRAGRRGQEISAFDRAVARLQSAAIGAQVAPL